MSNSPVISLTNLTVGYDDKPVLSDITLNLEPGKLVCFMGPNGAGKSTLIRSICQFQPTLEGSILIEGRDIRDCTRQELAKKISVVLTDRLNAGQLTGREIISAGRYPYTGWSGRLQQEDWNMVESAMEKTGTRHLADRPFYEMSDGQRQKVMIARALCQHTPVIILDEPTAHLDLNNRVAIVTLLRQLAQQEKRAVLMATHELDLALQLADELWLAEPGKGILRGVPEDLVLNGLLDRVFQFKGYDLKTGSVIASKTGRKVALHGEDFLYLWTKNALERNGYELDHDSPVTISVASDPEPEWEMKGRNYETLASLLQALDAHFKASDL